MRIHQSKLDIFRIRTYVLISLKSFYFICHLDFQKKILVMYSTLLFGKRVIWLKLTFKGRVIAKTFNNFNRLNHHWPKILPNLNSYFGKVVRIQIGENFRSVVVQTVEIVKGFRDKSTFTLWKNSVSYSETFYQPM